MLGGPVDLTKLEKDIDTIGRFQKGGNYFFTTQSPDQMEKDVLLYLGKEEVEPTVNKEKKYKLEFEF